MTFFCAALLLLLLSGLLAIPGRSGSTFWDRLSLMVGMAGVLLGLGATLNCLLQPQAPSLSLPWSGGAHCKVLACLVGFLLTNSQGDL